MFHWLSFGGEFICDIHGTPYHCDKCIQDGKINKSSLSPFKELTFHWERLKRQKVQKKYRSMRLGGEEVERSLGAGWMSELNHDLEAEA